MNRRKFLIGGAALGCATLGASWPVYRAFGSVPNHHFSSPNWIDGAFRNLPESYAYAGLDKERNYTGGWLKFFFSHGGDRYPKSPVPSSHFDLHTLADGEFVWLGHSSLLCKLAGKIICFDPVLSSHASPLPGIIAPWAGATPYTAADIPPIDYLCISHDHWDHLDYPTIRALKFKKLFCGKGTGAHFKYWGIGPEPMELDWFEASCENGLRFIFTPSHHYSGRGTTRNKSLWGGFIVDAGSGGKLYFTGDGGYGPHFGAIGQKYGPFEIIFPDCGQYNRGWPRVHMFPEEAVQASLDAGARLACPAHNGKFTLAWHPWAEPSERFSANAQKRCLPFILPVIGERRSMAEKA